MTSGTGAQPSLNQHWGTAVSGLRSLASLGREKTSSGSARIGTNISGEGDTHTTIKGRVESRNNPASGLGSVDAM